MLEVFDEELAPGVVVGGRYRLEAVLGEGGMGVVWRATDEAQGGLRALKFLRPGREADPKNQARLAREARAAMSIDHPNVAKVHAVLESDAGVPYMVMDLLEGESLRQRLRREPRLPERECARIFGPVASAVQAAHARRIIHRDLKPENVFLEGDRVLVLDFGIAKEIRAEGEDGPPSLTSTGTLMGTPAYMAPEQLFSEPNLDGRVDVWALGVMLYEALSGVHPTGYESFGQILKTIVANAIVPLAQRSPDVRPDLAQLVDRMLTRARGARPPLAEVRAILAGEPYEAEPDSADAAPRTERLPSTPSLSAHPLVSSTLVASPRLSPAPALAPTLAPGLAPTVVPALAPAPALAPTPAPAIVPARAPALAYESTTAAPVVGRASADPPPPEAVAPRRRASLPALLVAGGAIVAIGAVGTGVVLARARPRPLGEAELLREGELQRAAHDALARRDGERCIAVLDERDALDPSALVRSTNPASPLATDRASCLMLTKRCRQGKELFAKAYRERNPPGILEEHVAGQVLDAMATYCDGDDLDDTERAARGFRRLDLASRGELPSTGARCEAWYRESRTNLPRARFTKGGLYADTSYRLAEAVVGCYVRSKDCDAAFSRWLVEYDLTHEPATEPAKRQANAAVKFDELQTGCPKRAP